MNESTEKQIISLHTKVDDLGGTVDKLAELMLHGFEKISNELTEFKNEVAEKFQKVEENFVTVRRDIMNTGDRFPSLYMFDKLVKRVTLLEEKEDKGA